MSRDLDEDDDDDETPNVEVERMPNLDDWEFFKAVDAADNKDRWTLALQHHAKQSKIEFALWTDPKKDPEVTGILDLRESSDKRWAKAVREALKHSDDNRLDDDARSELILAILKKHDPKLDDYEDRLLFTLDAHSEDDDDTEGDDTDD